MSESAFVVVHTAPGFQQAKILAGFLASEGIAAKVPGAELTDEFGMSMKIGGPVDVVVPRTDLERATDIVAAWNDRAESDEEPAAD